MKNRMRQLFAALLAAILCLSLLVGCSDSKKDSSDSDQISDNSGTLGKNSKDNTLLFITTDNKWMISKAEEDADSAVLSDCVFADAANAAEFGLSPQAIPGYNLPGFVWFSPDGQHVYFLTNMDTYYMTATLCHLNRSDLKKDFSNAEDCVEILSENIVMSENNQIVDNGIIYRTTDGELCYYTGSKNITLAKNVFAASCSHLSYSYPNLADDLPETGDAAFIVTNNGKTVLYCTKKDDTLELHVRATNGNGEATVLGSNIYQFFCSPNSNTVFYTDKDYFLYTATLDGTIKQLSEGKASLISSFDDRAYFKEEHKWYLYDGKESHLIFDDGGYNHYKFFYGDAENQIAIYRDHYEETWYCTVGANQTNSFPFENGRQRWEYCGVMNNGTEIVLRATDDNKEVVILTLTNDKITDVKTLATGCWRAHIRNGNELFFLAKNEESRDDLMLYSNGTLSVIGTSLAYSRTNTYSDNTVLTLKGSDSKPGELVTIKDGNESHIANEVSYFLRFGKGEVLYLSDDVLYLYSGDTALRLFENVAVIFCANAEYNSGAMYIDYPEFGDKIYDGT